jgi:hypothetical protein
MKTLATIILLLSLSGCSLFLSPCKNVERLSKKHKVCYDAIKQDISLDTTLPEIKVVVEKEIHIDSAANDSIMALLDSCRNDMTVEEKIVYRDKIKQIFLNNLKIEATDTTVDNLNIIMWIEDGKIKASFKRLETDITVTGQTEKLQVKPQGTNWKPIIVSSVLLILLGLGLYAMGKYFDWKKKDLERQDSVNY